jgi:hypothetical protein
MMAASGALANTKSVTACLQGPAPPICRSYNQHASSWSLTWTQTVLRADRGRANGRLRLDLAVRYRI